MLETISIVQVELVAISYLAEDLDLTSTVLLFLVHFYAAVLVESCVS